MRANAPWGIAVPDDDEHTVYVWLDALANYLTVCDFGADDTQAWPGAGCTHIVGKDILRFHCIMWPAVLLAAGLEPPASVVAHAHWTVEGRKMSKSLGNVVAPGALMERFGIDAVRYFLLRNAGIAQDGNFSEGEQRG